MFFAFLLSGSMAIASTTATTFTISGKIADKLTGAPLLDPSTLLKISVASSNGCLLYEESQYVDLSATGGAYNLQVGSNISSTKRTSKDPGLSLETAGC